MLKFGVKWLRATETSKRLAVVMALGAGTLASPVLAQETDPWENINRSIFKFNDTLDRYALKPIAKGYQAVTPDIVETGISNAFNNLGEVTNLVNNLLQGKPKDAGVDTSRFLLNTTFGILGFIDVATKMGLDRNNEDFGQTLGVWGVKSGPYVVLPFWGPSSVRDTAAKLPNAYTTVYPYMGDITARNALYAMDVIDTRAQLLSAEKMITGDRYIFIRNAYLQNREFEVQDGLVEDDF